jgi:hypothetical protein
MLKELENNLKYSIEKYVALIYMPFGVSAVMLKILYSVLYF